MRSNKTVQVESLYVNMPHSPTSTSIRFDIEVLVLGPMFFEAPAPMPLFLGPTEAPAPGDSDE